MAGLSQALYARGRRIIPGGTQLLSKRPEMLLPEQWPAYYRSATGTTITDLDGNAFLDMSVCGIGSTVLGYADPDVNAAVIRAIELGSMATLNVPEEVELADLILELHPWAEMARFTRAGGEALAVAIRIARAATGRDRVAFCGYHGWHDWYLSANLSQDSALDGHLLPGLVPSGVPRTLHGSMIPFRFNQIDDLERAADMADGRLAAIIMEPVRTSLPDPDFLDRARAIADLQGAALIFDEVTSGFRVNTGGFHLTTQVKPDMAVYAKAIANGFPMGAIIGTSAFMDAAQETFVSSTAWTERTGPAAAIATIRKFRELNVSAHLQNIGQQVQDGWRVAADKSGLQISVSGITPLSHLGFQYDDAQAVRTLFTQMMLDQGILAGGAFYPMYAHSTADVGRYLEAIDTVFANLAAAIDKNGVHAQLRGPVAHQGFQRLT